MSSLKIIEKIHNKNDESENNNKNLLKSSRSSSMEITYLDPFERNENQKSFKFDQSIENLKFTERKSKEHMPQIESGSKKDMYSIKMNNGFTFIETLEISHSKLEEDNIFKKLCNPLSYKNNIKCDICLSEFNMITNRKKIWFIKKKFIDFIF